MSVVVKKNGNQFFYMGKVADSLWSNPRSGVQPCESEELAKQMAAMIRPLLPTEIYCTAAGSQIEFYLNCEELT